MNIVGSADLTHEYVCAFRGSRDHYQAALALSEVQRLHRLVTDFYSPDSLANSGLVPARWRSKLARRHVDGLPSRLARNRLRSAVPLASGRFDGHKVDDGLGELAARHAADGALIYSYYWHGFRQQRAAGESAGPQVLFQVHPFASQIKRILSADREKSGILEALEPEERLSDAEIRDRESESLTADAIIATSEFVRRGILDVSTATTPVGVTPYGADRPVRLAPDAERRSSRGPIKLLWVGQLSYRKGAHWLIEAMRAVGGSTAELTIVTRDSPPGWLGTLPPNVIVRNGVGPEALSHAFQAHDCFVMPSLVEGYGLVYAESLAHGLPIIATPNSGAPDLIEPGENGLLVAPGSLSELVGTIERLRSEPDLMFHLQMGARAASLPAWQDFRGGIRTVLKGAERALPIDPISVGRNE